MTIELYSDGACSNNGAIDAVGGWAYVVLCDGQPTYKGSGAVKGTTNNRMEYQALINGIYQAVEAYPHTPIICYSDSALLVNTVNDWMKRWKANGWTKKGGPIKNLDLVKELDELFSRYVLILKKVEGHAGVEWNECCDRMAVAARCPIK